MHEDIISSTETKSSIDTKRTSASNISTKEVLVSSV